MAKNYLDKKGHPKALFSSILHKCGSVFFLWNASSLSFIFNQRLLCSLENNEEVAYGIYAAYGALVYLTPLIGGYLADKYIGYRKSILYGGVLMALGHFFMAFPTDFFFYGALGLLIMGNGFLNPIYQHWLGHYEEGDIKKMVDLLFFIWSINLGAMIAPLFCGYLELKPMVAFQVWSGWYRDAYGFSCFLERNHSKCTWR